MGVNGALQTFVPIHFFWVVHSRVRHARLALPSFVRLVEERGWTFQRTYTNPTLISRDPLTKQSLRVGMCITYV